MQWRRRHCWAHTVKLISVLSLLGVLVFLVNQVWLPRFAGTPWWKGHPVVFGAGRNTSGKQLGWRFVIVPQPTDNAAENASSHEKSDVPSQQGAQSFDHALTNASQTDGDNGGSIADGPFRYIINEPNKCSGNRAAPFLVLLIATEARQVEERNAIRQTWANESVAPPHVLTRIFLLGRTNGELGLLQQGMLQAESRRHHDIIQQDFLDTYKNLTLKTLMGLNWVAAYCPRASYVMKTDSDMFVNTEYLVYKLLRPELKPRDNYFTGNNMRGFGPNRNKNSKWYMPPELYPGETYPAFCSGTGYVFSGDLAKKIYQASLSIPYLHLEDVYVGVCLAKLQIEPTPPPNEFLFNHWRVPYSSCKYSHLITSHGFHHNELLKYWNHLQVNKNNACIHPAKVRAGQLHPIRAVGDKEKSVQ